MNIISQILIRFSSDLIGEDQYGNKYYSQKKTGKRYIIFNGKVEASKIPPMWHAWLHKTIEDPPLNYSHKYFWQKNHEENLTGTKKAYYPDEHPLSKANHNKVKKNEYESWSP